MQVECTHCLQSFTPETMSWARNIVLGEEAQGRDPNIDPRFSPWYGIGGHWMKCDVKEYEARVDRGVCEACEERRQEALDQSAELCSPCPPAWFDESFAGERW